MRNDWDDFHSNEKTEIFAMINIDFASYLE